MSRSTRTVKIENANFEYLASNPTSSKGSAARFLYKQAELRSGNVKSNVNLADFPYFSTG